jgi:hypothetical protein
MLGRSHGGNEVGKYARASTAAIWRLMVATTLRRFELLATTLAMALAGLD